MKPETEHTPGPWVCFDKPKYNEWHVAVPINGQGLMKLALFEHGCQTNNPEADCRLIAAAPELLSFVEKMERMLICERDCYYEGCSAPDGDVPDQHDKDILKSMDADIDEARALIAKAKGIK